MYLWFKSQLDRNDLDVCKCRRELLAISNYYKILTSASFGLLWIDTQCTIYLQPSGSTQDMSIYYRGGKHGCLRNPRCPVSYGRLSLITDQRMPSSNQSSNVLLMVEPSEREIARLPNQPHVHLEH